MFGLEKLSVLLGNASFTAFKNTLTNEYLFAERVKQLGVLDFGFVQANQTSRISLAANQITSLVCVESIIVTAPGTTGDEVTVKVFRNGQQIAYQRFSNNDMPLKHPPLVLTPDLEVEVQPKYDSAVFIYVSPVDLIFRATPS